MSGPGNRYLGQLLSKATEETHYMLDLHRDHHSYWGHGKGLDEIQLSERDLSCEICCGVPPWDWKDFYVEQVIVEPVAVRIDGHRYRSNRAGKSRGKYLISYVAFTWRTPRVWGCLDYPMGYCRECKKWSRVANHMTPGALAERGKYIGYGGWKKLHICLKCVKSENRSIKNEDPKKAINRLLSELNGSKNRRYVK